MTITVERWLQWTRNIGSTSITFNLSDMNTGPGGTPGGSPVAGDVMYVQYTGFASQVSSWKCVAESDSREINRLFAESQSNNRSAHAETVLTAGDITNGNFTISQDNALNRFGLIVTLLKTDGSWETDHVYVGDRTLYPQDHVGAYTAAGYDGTPAARVGDMAFAWFGAQAGPPQTFSLPTGWSQGGQQTGDNRTTSENFYRLVPTAGAQPDVDSSLSVDNTRVTTVQTIFREVQGAPPATVTPAKLTTATTLGQSGFTEAGQLEPAKLATAVVLKESPLTQDNQLAPAALTTVPILKESPLEVVNLVNPAELTTATTLDASSITAASVYEAAWHLYQASVSAADTTWVDSKGNGDLTIDTSGGSRGLNGGIVTGTDSGYARGNVLLSFGTVDFTYAVRYLDETAAASFTTATVSTATVGSGADRIRTLRNTGTGAAMRDRSNVVYSTPSPVSRSDNGPERAVTNVQQLQVVRFYNDNGTPTIKVYDSATGLTITDPFTGDPFYDGIWTHLTIGANQALQSGAGRNLTGLAFWEYDIGEAAALSLSPTDPEWLPAEIPVSPAKLTTATTLDQAQLTQANQLVPAELTTASELEGTSLVTEEPGNIIPNPLTTATTLASSLFQQGNQIAPASLATVTTLDSSAFTEAALIEPARLLTKSVLDATSFDVSGTLAPDRLVTITSLDQSGFTQDSLLAPDSLATVTTLDGTTVFVGIVLEAADLTTRTLLGTAVTEGGVLVVNPGQVFSVASLGRVSAIGPQSPVTRPVPT